MNKTLALLAKVTMYGTVLVGGCFILGVGLGLATR